MGGTGGGGGGPADPICLSVLVSTWGHLPQASFGRQHIKTAPTPSCSYGSELKLKARRRPRSSAALSLCHKAGTQVQEWRRSHSWWPGLHAGVNTFVLASAFPSFFGGQEKTGSSSEMLGERPSAWGRSGSHDQQQQQPVWRHLWGEKKNNWQGSWLCWMSSSSKKKLSLQNTTADSADETCKARREDLVFRLRLSTAATVDCTPCIESHLCMKW